MEMTEHQAPPRRSAAWLLAVIVAIAGLVIGAVGEAVVVPRVIDFATVAQGRITAAVDALSGVIAKPASPSPSVAETSTAPAASAAPRTTTAVNAATTATDEPYVAVVQKAGPAVVTVVNQMPPQITMFGQIAQPEALGSGVIIDQQGHIVTNNHVIEGGSQFQVIFSDGRKAPARLVGRDQISDIAVLKVDGPVPAVATFGNSDELQIGQRVVAIGSALGDFRNTVTHGIISGVNRTLSDPNGPTLTGLIQTDAPINHGNSGGPLLDLQGRVIGINTAVVRGSGFGGDVAEGLGFAIPSNTVKQIADQLIKNGYVVRPFLGVSWTPLSPQIASYYGLSVTSGALIQAVQPGSPASAAGLRPGDVVTRVDDVAIDEQHDFASVLLSHKVGDRVRLTVQRGSQVLTLTATLAERPQELQ